MGTIKNGGVVLGIDDAPFDRVADTKCLLTGVLMRLDFRIDAIFSRSIAVDGEDVTDAIVSMINSSHGRETDVIMTNGITFAGMNILDISRLHTATEVPIICVSRRKPDLESMKSALMKHNQQKMDQFRERLNHPVVRMDLDSTRHVYVNLEGIGQREAMNLLKKTCKNGNVPDPIRLSHMIGSAMRFGESRGKP
ncbi:MAG: endonuclease dU [Thermoplasmataceae archaeon]